MLVAKHSNQSRSTVLPRARIGKALARNCTQAEGVVEFPVGNQAGIGSHHRSAKLELQSAVEIEPENAIIRVARRVRHDSLIQIIITY
jgi:hypothetical protein